MQPGDPGSLAGMDIVQRTINVKNLVQRTKYPEKYQ